MHPDDLYDAGRAEELDEREPDHFDPGPDWRWPPAAPGMTRRSLGWARAKVPPRHTGTTRDRGLDAAGGVINGCLITLMAAILLGAIIMLVLTLTL